MADHSSSTRLRHTALGFVLATVVSSLVAGGCGDGGDPHTGGDGGSGASCTFDSTTADTCGGDTICVDGRCKDAFDRSYSLGVRELSISERTSDGECWDSGCGAPDPSVCITLDEEELGCTTAIEDRFEVLYSPPVSIEGTVTAASSATWEFTDADADESAHDPIMTCDKDLSADTLRSRMFPCESESGTTATLFVEPL